VLRAVLVGFVLGFALIGLARVSADDRSGAKLTRTSAMARGAALDHVAQQQPCRKTAYPRQILI
jgi:hypothetical protein